MRVLDFLASCRNLYSGNEHEGAGLTLRRGEHMILSKEQSSKRFGVSFPRGATSRHPRTDPSDKSKRINRGWTYE